MNEPAPPEKTPSEPLTVYYDGACPLCRREIDFYRRRDAGAPIDWVDVSAATAESLAPDLTRSDALARFHVRLPDGTLASGAHGFGELWSVMPGFSRVGRMVRHRRVRPAVEVLYRTFLRIRPLIQRIAARADARSAG